MGKPKVELPQETIDEVINLRNSNRKRIYEIANITGLSQYKIKQILKENNIPTKTLAKIECPVCAKKAHIHDIPNFEQLNLIDKSIDL